MSLTREEVESIAHLARLRITPDEIAAVADKLSRIIEFVDQLRSADTTAVSPMAHPLNMTQRLRTDVVTESDQRERLQQDAPRVENGYYVVPAVIE